MSRRADCYDNAPMESFFHTLKTELVRSLNVRFGPRAVIKPTSQFKPAAQVVGFRGALPKPSYHSLSALDGRRITQVQLSD
jgi:transposase InsO family protein